MRIGIGYDVHRLVQGRPLILGGIHIPYEKGLLGHSDGDVLLHAISDAILGAIGEGDIGVLYPDKDESIRGIDSAKILSHVCELALRKGYKIVNIDTVVVTEEPKIAPHRETMKAKIAGILKIDTSLVSIKGKTTEGLGFAGRREGIEVQAVVLVAETDERYIA